MTEEEKPGTLYVLPCTIDRDAVLAALREWMNGIEDSSEQCTGFAVVAIRGTGGSRQSYMCDGPGQPSRMQLIGAVYLLLDELVAAWRT
jgi:hypothetical protein